MFAKAMRKKVDNTYFLLTVEFYKLFHICILPFNNLIDFRHGFFAFDYNEANSSVQIQQFNFFGLRRYFFTCRI